MCAQSVQVSAIPWTVVHQVPPSMGLSRQEYWSVLPFLLQGHFLTQGWNLCLQHLLLWKVDSLPVSHLRSLAVQWWFLYYSFVNRGIQNYCGQQVVMCSGTEGSVSGYELCLSLSQTLFSLSQ